MDFGQRLSEERKRLGFNQTDFGKIGGVTKTSQVNYESSGRSPNVDYWQAISAIGADVQYILTGIRSQQLSNAELPANYADLNKKRLDTLMDDLTAEQQAEVIKLAEKNKRLNQCEVELNELKKNTA